MENIKCKSCNHMVPANETTCPLGFQSPVLGVIHSLFSSRLIWYTLRKLSQMPTSVTLQY